MSAPNHDQGYIGRDWPQKSPLHNSQWKCIPYYNYVGCMYCPWSAWLYESYKLNQSHLSSYSANVIQIWRFTKPSSVVHVQIKVMKPPPFDSASQYGYFFILDRDKKKSIKGGLRSIRSHETRTTRFSIQYGYFLMFLVSIHHLDPSTKIPNAPHSRYSTTFEKSKKWLNSISRCYPHVIPISRHTKLANSMKKIVPRFHLI